MAFIPVDFTSTDKKREDNKKREEKHVSVQLNMLTAPTSNSHYTETR